MPADLSARRVVSLRLRRTTLVRLRALADARGVSVSGVVERTVGNAPEMGHTPPDAQARMAAVERLSDLLTVPPDWDYREDRMRYLEWKHR